MEEENETNLKSFLEWAASLGISDSPNSHCPFSSCLGHSLSVSHFPQAGGRGLAATRDIKKGELILRVPKAALLTSDTLIAKDHNLSAAFGKHPLLSSTQILSISLLNEVSKGWSSGWYPYLMQLPRSYELLASFTQFSINVLQMDDAIWTAEKAIQKCKLEWEEASPIVDELSLKAQFMTFKAWLWASATISSRTMHIPWDTAGCLCPVGDFFNYTPPGEEFYYSENLKSFTSQSLNINSSCKGDTTGISTHELVDESDDRLIDAGYNEAIGCYCFYARRNYTAGDQVLLSYGTYTNLELIEHYGFLLHGNPNDKAFIPLEPEMYTLCTWPKESLYISQGGKPSFALLSTLRLWATPVSKRRSVGHIAYSGHQISAKNEVATTQWIAKKCQLLLGSCSTSIEEDTLLLHIINNIKDSGLSLEYGKVSPALNDEICSFFESHDAMSGKHCANFNTSAKTRRSIDMWKLAVQWRYEYKKILSDCISHCNKMLDDTFC